MAVGGVLRAAIRAANWARVASESRRQARALSRMRIASNRVERPYAGSQEGFRTLTPYPSQDAGYGFVAADIGPWQGLGSPPPVTLPRRGYGNMEYEFPGLQPRSARVTDLDAIEDATAWMKSPTPEDIYMQRWEQHNRNHQKKFLEFMNQIADTRNDYFSFGNFAPRTGPTPRANWFN